MRDKRLLVSRSNTEVKLFLNEYMIDNNTWIGLNFESTPTLNDILSNPIVYENIKDDPEIERIKISVTAKSESKTYFYNLRENVLELVACEVFEDELDIYDLLEDGALYADSKTRAAIEIVLFAIGLTILILFLRADCIENVTLYIIVTSVIMLILLFDLTKEKIEKWLKNIMQ